MKTIRNYGSLAEAGFAGSLLEAAGIQALLKGEESFSMVPGAAMAGIELQVPEEDAEKALRILEKGFEAVADVPVRGGPIEQEAPASRDETSNGARGPQIPVGLLVVGAIILGLVFFAVHQMNTNRRTWGSEQAAGPRDADYDHDGHPDHFFVYRDDGTLSRMLVDHNGDRAVDEWIDYDREGRVEHVEADTNYDTRPDVWYTYAKGELQSWKRDADFDGIPDWFGTCEHGLTVHADCRPGDSAVVIRRHIFVHGNLTEELVDDDQDGKFDYKYLFDPLGVRSERMPLGESE